MSNTFFKRVIPFILALSFGLFITSFFMDIKPNIQLKRSKWSERHKMKKLKYENRQLKRENQRLTDRIEAKERIILLDVPPPPPAPRVMVVPSDSVPSNLK